MVLAVCDRWFESVSVTVVEFVTEGKLLGEDDSVRSSETDGVTVGLEKERDADWNSVSVSSEAVWD